MVKTFGEMDGGTIEVHRQGQKKSGKLTRQINSPTRPNLPRSKKASRSKAQNENIVVDKAKVSSSGAKLTNTGPHQHSYRESNVSRKRVISEDIEGATELKRLPTPINLFEDECVFCHSFRTSPFHGPMVRYLKGRIVSIDEGKASNATYVHRKCLEWAPEVCYKDDIVVNLELEISRASRLRCSKCGLHGAALGCYYKHCNKSFHVPCAVQIFDCRWDVDHYNVLCPEHVSKTLKCDGMSSQTKESDNSSSLPQSQYSDKEGNFDDYQRESQQTDQLDTSNSSPKSQCLHREETSTNSSREGQQIDQLNTLSSSSLPLGQQLDKEEISNYHERDYQQKDQLGKLKTSNYSSLRQSCHPDEEGISDACQVEEIKEDQLDTPSCPSNQWILLGSSLSTSEKFSLQDFASWTDATVTKEWDNNVTHVIVGKNDGTWSRSYEVLMAILSGKWVVQVDWIVDCLEELLPGPEALYEVTFSNESRTIDGPKKGRIRATEGAPKLFSGLYFCLSAYMNPDDRQRMQDLIAAAGGQIFEGSNLHPLYENSDDSSVKPYFIHDGGTFGEFAPKSLLDLRHKEMEEVAEHAAAGAHVISLFRVLEAIAAYDAQILNHSDHLTPHAPYTSQHSDKEGISNDHERDDQQTHQLETPNSSVPQGHHPGRGMSNAYQREEIETDQPDTLSYPSDQLVLIGLSLSATEKDSLQEFASWTNTMVTKEWAENVTHVVVGKNSGSTWSRSYEVLMAILFGKWVVQIEWIVDCLELCPGPEASYEAPKLFSGLCFCLSYFMNPDDRHRMRDLIAAAGGRVLQLRHEDSSAVRPYFVYDGGAPGEFTASLLRMEMEEAKEHAAVGAQVISHHRVLDAVAAYDAEVLNQKD